MPSSPFESAQYFLTSHFTKPEKLPIYISDRQCAGKQSILPGTCMECDGRDCIECILRKIKQLKQKNNQTKRLSKTLRQAKLICPAFH